LGGVKSKLRRLWLVCLRPSYVRAQRERREGACLQCANCCRLGFRCLFLRRGRCLIYPLRPPVCRAFPLDERDVTEACCPGYRFKGEGSSKGVVYPPG